MNQRIDLISRSEGGLGVETLVVDDDRAQNPVDWMITEDDFAAVQNTNDLVPWCTIRSDLR